METYFLLAQAFFLKCDWCCQALKQEPHIYELISHIWCTFCLFSFLFLGIWIYEYFFNDYKLYALAACFWVEGSSHSLVYLIVSILLQAQRNYCWQRTGRRRLCHNSPGNILFLVHLSTNTFKHQCRKRIVVITGSIEQHVWLLYCIKVNDTGT